MQRACKEFKQKIEKINQIVSLEKTKNLLEEYRESPTEELKEKIKQRIEKEKKKIKQEEVDRLKENVSQKTKELLQEYPHSDEFIDEVSLKDGKVIVRDDLDLMYPEQVYLPSIIDIVEGYLWLGNITSAENLDLPDTIKGGLNLNSLTSSKHLDFSNTRIEGDIYLDSLSQEERSELKEKYPQYEDQITTYN